MEKSCWSFFGAIFAIHLCAIFATPCTGATLTCFQCIGVNDPFNCNLMANCSDDQECYTEAVKVDGRVQFNMGCQRREVCQFYETENLNPNNQGTGDHGNVCEQCCPYDTCNRDLCRHEATLTCLGCQGINDPKNCNLEVPCPPDHECSTEAKVKDGEIYYDMGCKLKAACAVTVSRIPYLLPGNETGYCNKCCTFDNCAAEICPLGEVKYLVQDGWGNVRIDQPMR